MKGRAPHGKPSNTMFPSFSGKKENTEDKHKRIPSGKVWKIKVKITDQSRPLCKSSCQHFTCPSLFCLLTFKNSATPHRKTRAVVCLQSKHTRRLFGTVYTLFSSLYMQRERCPDDSSGLFGGKGCTVVLNHFRWAWP